MSEFFRSPRSRKRGNIFLFFSGGASRTRFSRSRVPRKGDIFPFFLERHIRNFAAARQKKARKSLGGNFSAGMGAASAVFSFARSEDIFVFSSALPTQAGRAYFFGKNFCHKFYNLH